MTRRMFAILWICLLFATRTADAAVTWHFDPELAHEANPLARVLGGGWTVLVAVNVLACLLIGWTTLAWYRSGPRTDLALRSRSAWDYAALLLFGRTMPRWQFLLFHLTTILPREREHRAALVHLLGFVMPPVLAVAGLVAVALWVATHGWRQDWVVGLHRMLGYGLLLAPVGLAFVAAEASFFRIEFHRACRASANMAPKENVP